MPRYSNSVVELSALGNFETEIRKLYRQRRAEAERPPINATNAFAPNLNNVPEDYKFASILIDRGAGRISSGLKSLELLSLLCAGVPPNKLFLFDNVIYAGSATAFASGTDEELTKLVIANIGMTTIVDNLPPSRTANISSVALRIAKTVKSGGYTADMYSAFMRRESKDLTEIYIDRSRTWR